MSAALTPATPAAMRQYADVPGLEALDVATGETFSATAGDYWQVPDDRPLTGADGEPLILVRRVVTLEPVGADEDEESEGAAAKRAPMVGDVLELHYAGGTPVLSGTVTAVSGLEVVLDHGSSYNLALAEWWRVVT